MRACILLIVPLLAPAAERLTLEEALSRAAKNNPSVDAARLSALASHEVVTQTRSALFPNVTALASGLLAPANTRAILGTFQNPTMLSRVGIGFMVNQLVTDFGRTSKLTESSRFRASAEDQSARGTRAQVALQVSAAYVAALRAQSIQRVATQTVSTRQAIVDQITALAASNLKSDLDVQFATVSLTEAKLLETTARNDRAAALADLANAMGLRTTVDFELVDVPADATSPDFEAIIDDAITRNPEASVRRHLLNAALAQASAEQRAFYPNLTASATAGVVPVRTERFPRDNYSVAGFTLTVPILNGKQLAARRTETELRARAARKALTESENRVARNTSVTLIAIRTAAERLGLARAMVDGATQAMDLAQVRYDLGLSSIVELTQAQLSLVSAEIQVASAQYDLALQHAILDFHIGTTP